MTEYVFELQSVLGGSALQFLAIPTRILVPLRYTPFPANALTGEVGDPVERIGKTAARMISPAAGEMSLSP